MEANPKFVTFIRNTSIHHILHLKKSFPKPDIFRINLILIPSKFFKQTEIKPILVSSIMEFMNWPV